MANRDLLMVEIQISELNSTAGGAFSREFNLFLPLQLTPLRHNMNPFILLTITVANFFVAWHSVMPSSYIFSLLLHPIPPVILTPAVHILTINTGNVSFAPRISVLPYLSIVNLSYSPSQSTGPFPQDLRIISALPATNQGVDDLQNLGFGENAQVHEFTNTLQPFNKQLTLVHRLIWLIQLPPPWTVLTSMFILRL